MIKKTVVLLVVAATVLAAGCEPKKPVGHENLDTVRIETSHPTSTKATVEYAATGSDALGVGITKTYPGVTRVRVVVTAPRGMRPWCRILISGHVVTNKVGRTKGGKVACEYRR